MDPLNPLSWAGGLASDLISQLAQPIMEAMTVAETALGTFWILLPSPEITGNDHTHNDVASHAPGAAGLTTVLGWVQWWALGFCVIGIMIVGARMGLQHRRGEAMTHIGRIGWVGAAAAAIGLASEIATFVLPAFGTSGGSKAVAFVQDSLWWWTGGLVVLSILVAAGRTALEMRGQPLIELAKSLLTLMVVSSSAVAGIGFATALTDGYSIWVLAGAVGDKTFQQNLTLLLGSGMLAPLGPFIESFLGFIAFCVSCGQIIMMIVRGIMLIILAGVIPTAAAFTNLETGRTWFKKLIGWGIAFLFYKPAATIIYAVAFKLIGTPLFAQNGLVQVLQGLVAMVLALVSIGPLMRFAVPAVSVLSSGSGAGLGMAIAALGGGLLGDAASNLLSKFGQSGSDASNTTPATGSAPPPATPASQPAATGSSPSGTPQSGSSSGPTQPGGPAAPGAATGSASTGAATGSAASGAAGGAAATGAAAAAGPIGLGVAAAQKAADGLKQAGAALAGAAASAVNDSTNS